MRVLERCIDFVLDPLLESRARRMGSLIGSHLQAGEHVLDVGCGDMRVSKAIAKTKKVKILGIDIVNYNKTDLKFHNYDGKKIPFKDKSYDTVIFSFVLHHTPFKNQLKLIEEAKRVSRSKVIILEDTYDSWMGLQLTKLHDVCVNKPLCFSIPCPFTFRRISDWKNIFERNGLQVQKVQPISSLPVKFQRQQLFLLKKSALK